MMSDYYVDPRVREAHEAHIRSIEWMAVNTLSPIYPNLMAIAHKHPHMSVSEANAMIDRNRVPAASTQPVSKKKPLKNAQERNCK
jgi:hypothetical protein